MGLGLGLGLGLAPGSGLGPGSGLALGLALGHAPGHAPGLGCGAGLGLGLGLGSERRRVAMTRTGATAGKSALTAWKYEAEEASGSIWKVPPPCGKTRTWGGG